MDPFLISLIWAIGVGVSSVAGKLADKGFDAAAKPVIDKLAGLVKGGLEQAERETKLADAIRAAIEDSTKDLSGFRKPERSESEFAKYAREIGLERLTLKGNRALLDRVIALSLISSSRDDSALVSDALLHELNLEPNQRAPFARFLYHLRVRLNEISEFQPMIRLAHETNMENAARIIILEIAGVRQAVTKIARAVTTDAEGQPAVRIVTSEAAWDARPYLKYLERKFNTMRLAVFNPKWMGESPVTLDEIYTDLDVEERIPLPESERAQRRERALFDQEHETRRLTALEAISDPTAPKVVLLGYPGSGKSTFVNYLARCLVKEQLEQDSPEGLARLEGWTQGARLPVRIVLREFVAWADAKKIYGASPKTVWDYLAYLLDEKEGFSSDAPRLISFLKREGGIFLFDGLDEVREADRRREWIKQAIESFADVNESSRFVVTCRPVAYRPPEKQGEPDWRLAGFRAHKLATLDQGQIENFIDIWYKTIAPREGQDQTWIDTKTFGLREAVRVPHLAALADKPLLLTLTATLHASNQLPEDRADLYERAVNLLLEDWQQFKQEDNLEQGTQITLAALGVQLNDLRSALSRVAFEAHAREAKSAKEQRKPEAYIGYYELLDGLRAATAGDLTRAERLLEYIQTRAGLLLAQDSRTFTFLHRSFQEFMAARHLTTHNPDELAQLVLQDEEWWREVFLLAAGFSRGWQALMYINALCPREIRRDEIPRELELRIALLAAQAGAEIGLQKAAASSPFFATTLTKLQNWLIAILAQELLTLTERAEAGRLLSKLGDARAEVNCEIPTTLPVAAGEFVMGGDGPYDGKPIHYVTLSDFRIGKYPVTNAQFRLFVQGDGYTNRAYWKYDEGWDWKNRNKITKPEYWDDPQWNLENHPVVGVSWYEADAYCEWLTVRDEKNEKRKFRLPTEAEWEKAASWDDSKKSKRVYAWGDEFDGQKGNVSASEIGRTSAVGLFSNYPSPCGAMDMTGNVWEWCADWYDGKYYENPPQENPQGPSSGIYRVRRGAAFFVAAGNARCAYRLRLFPDNRLLYLGFRVAVPPA